MKLFSSIAAFVMLAFSAAPLAADEVAVEKSKAPINYVDLLYIQLDNLLDQKPLDQAAFGVLVGQIVAAQTAEMGIASVGLAAYNNVARALDSSGDAELAALQAIGYNSLYMYDSQRSTIGDGFQAYYQYIERGYLTQTILFGFLPFISPKAIVANWNREVRKELKKLGLDAAQGPAPRKFNNQVITAIDYLVQQAQLLNPADPVQNAILQNTLGIIGQGIAQASGAGVIGGALQASFAPVAADIANQQALLAAAGYPQSAVLQSLAEATPGQNAVTFYSAVGTVYTELNTILINQGYANPPIFFQAYAQRRPILITAAEGPY